MAIAHIGTDSKVSAASAATLNVTKPTGITPGASDRLILVVQTGNSGGAVGSYIESAGWTAIGSVLNVAGGGNISLQAWHAAGDVTLAAFNRTGSATDLAWVMACFSGVDTTTPIDATGTANSNTAATSLTTNAVTIATDQAWHLIGFSDWNNGVYSATGFTVSSTPTSNDEAALLYNTTPKSVGSTGTVIVSDSAAAASQALIGIPFALRPAGAAGGGAGGGVWIGPAQLPNRFVGPIVLRSGRRSSTPYDTTIAPVTDDHFGIPVPCLQVGPVVLRKRGAVYRTTPVDTTLAAVTDTNFGIPTILPHNRVGPMALRQSRRTSNYPFDTTAATPAGGGGNRLRRVICSGA